MHINLRGRHFLLIDIVLISLAYFIAFAIRFDLTLYQDYYQRFSLFTLWLLLTRLPTFYFLGLYRRLWQYASIKELIEIIFAVSVGSFLALLGVVLGTLILASPQSLAFPRSILIIEWLLTLLAIGGSRFALRILNENWLIRRDRSPLVKPTLIIGAGAAGATLAREMQTNPKTTLLPIGFIDDDPQKVGHEIRGLPILGNRLQLKSIATLTKARSAIIAMPTSDGETIRNTVRMCQQCGLETRIMPSIYELLDKKTSLTQLREIRVDDLLRRKPHLETLGNTLNYLTAKRVLITGGGGSIGSELARQVAHYQPSELVLLGHGENSIFEIQARLAENYPTLKLYPIIADIRDTDRLTNIFREHCPEIVFHAAAHKHVNLMELNPVEAITNNVFGTANALNSSQLVNVEKFVLVSTDKAVRPTNIMGATKRLAELLNRQVAQQTGKCYVTVRFGNVLGSRGSVLPIFQKQLAHGGPITITHPDVKRFFMSIPEASQLILRAGALGKSGEIFVLDMGEQVKILELAKDIIQLSGLQPDEVEIVYTGLKPGEKIEEELFTSSEVCQPTTEERILVINERRAENEIVTDVDKLVTKLKEKVSKGDTYNLTDFILESVQNI